MTTLLVIVPEAITDWIDKGELVDRYYNPGDLFDEVHIVLLNDDRPRDEDVQRLVGRARFSVHRQPVPRRLFLESAGWRPSLLRRWARPIVTLARDLRPALVRCYGPHLNTIAALEIKRVLGIPYVVSVHINPDEDVRQRARGWRARLAARAITRVEAIGLRHADLVLPVYEPIVPYLRRLGVERFAVAYNVINAEHIRPKSSYDLHRPARIISVGNQFASKDPRPIVHAVASIPSAQLTLVGDGPLHADVETLVQRLGANDRIELRRSVPNDDLCELLAEHDLFAVSTEYWELSKAVLEPLLTGLPVVLNRRQGARVPELTDDIVRYVDGSTDGYRQALLELLDDDDGRAALGRHARDVAERSWSPAATEQHVVELYRSLLGVRR